MQVSLNFAELTDFQLSRFANLFDAMREFHRSRPFNHFVFWTAREGEREVRARLLQLKVRHAVDIPVHTLRPGEIIFLERRMREWRDDFGESVMGELAEIFLQATWCCRTAGLESIWEARLAA